jgi:methionyl-tRNA synthetase
MSKKLYVTTTLPYVNSDPHVGFAMEIVRADSYVRYRRSLGDEVFFNTGTDEHGAKIFEGAKEKGIDTQDYVDQYAAKFKDLISALNISSDIHFIRTTDAHHKKAAQEMWLRCKNNGDIYKKNYKIKYCTGCELEKTDSELVDGKCSLHPNKEIEIREEENYFFRWSKYQEKLIDFYNKNPDFVVPDFRFNETKSFVSGGLEDFSVSRLKEKMPWGIPVPDDEGHVMYVWFDALTNYISTLGWPENTEDFNDYWKSGTPIQYCGKDNNRQQSAMWQAMLMSAELPNTKHIVIDGFITSNGQKMSKSLGNVINPFDVVEMFRGVTDFPEDVLRFVLLHDIPSFEDGDLTIDGIKESYRTHLQNGLGNLVSRVMKMATSYGVSLEKYTKLQDASDTLGKHMARFDLKMAISSIKEKVEYVDGFIQKEEPFKKIKTDEAEAKSDLNFILNELRDIAENLKVFLPNTAEKIIEYIEENKMPEKPLFGRLD